MPNDQPFEPRRGLVRAQRSAADGRYVNSIVAKVARSNSALSPRSMRPKFKGTRIGRGLVTAVALTGHEHFPEFRSRRVFVQVHVKYFRGTGVSAARRFVRYMQREGVTREGDPGRLYSATEDDPDGRAFVERCSGDRHHFRLMIAPEDSTEYDELKPLIRRFMARMEEDLGTALEWVAADHVDTINPHTHLMLRGEIETGGLIISPLYIFHGMRHRLAGMVSLDLGPRSEFEPFSARRPEIGEERLTPIDRRLLRDMDDHRVVRSMGRDMVDHSVRTGRLIKLSSLGLATELGAGRWRLSEDLDPILRKLGERVDMGAVLDRVCKSQGLDRPPSRRRIYSPSGGTVLTGRLVEDHSAGEVGSANCLIIDAVDGQLHYVAVGRDELAETIPLGAIVRVEPQADFGGHRSEAAVRVTLLSPVPLERLALETGATWLDEELSYPTAAPRGQGFGREVRNALAQRRAWLVEEGLASDDGSQFRCRPDMMTILSRRAIEQASLEIEKETGLGFTQLTPDCRLNGILRRRIDLPSGSFAQVEIGREFSLVPWHTALGRSIGERVAAVIRTDGEVRWTIGRSPDIER